MGKEILTVVQNRKKNIFVFQVLIAIFVLFLTRTLGWAEYGETSRWAGLGYYWGDGNPIPNCTFNYPEDIAMDKAGNCYIADCSNSVIRKISTDGMVSTLAGSGVAGYQEGIGADAQFNYPYGATPDPTGTYLYVADTENNMIRRIEIATGETSLVAGSGEPGYQEGIGSSVKFNSPMEVAIDSTGTYLYVADGTNNRIRRIVIASGETSLVAGGVSGYLEGTGSNARFSFPTDLIIDPTGTYLYVVDSNNNRIRRIEIATGVTSLVAGSTSGYLEDTGSNARFSSPWHLVIDPSNTYLYVSDYGNNRVRRIQIATGTTSLVAGNGQWWYQEGTGTQAIFNGPDGITIDLTGTYLYVIDFGNNLIRRIEIATNTTSLYAGLYYWGDGNTIPNVTFSWPMGLTLDASGTMFIADTGNYVIRKISSSGIVSTLSGSGIPGYMEGPAASAQFNWPAGITIDSTGIYLYLADQDNNRIRRVDALTGNTSLVAGSSCGYQEGIGSSAKFNYPENLIIDPIGTFLYVADTYNHRIRRIEIATGATSLVAGGARGYQEGTGAGAKFSWPSGITIDPTGTYLYVADNGNNMIRRIEIATGTTSLLAGSGEEGYQEGIGVGAKFSWPTGITIDPSGTYLYVCDSGNCRIRRIEISTGTTSLVAGSGEYGYGEGVGSEAVFSYPAKLTIDPAGSCLYVSDMDNGIIRKIDIVPNVTASPRWGTNDSSDFKIDLSGADFQSPATVILESETESDIVSSNTIVLTPGWIEAHFDLTGASPGPRDLRIQTGLLTITMPGEFTIVSAPADLSVSKCAPSPRPGFNLTYDIYYTNTGMGMAEDVQIRETLPAEVTYISSDPPAVYDPVNNWYCWEIGTVPAQGMGHVRITINVPVGVPLGTLLTDHAEIITTSLEEHIENNTCISEQIVVGSWDPNDKLVAPQGFISPDDMLTYIVRFENEGTAEAITIHIEDRLDDDLDENTLWGLSDGGIYDPVRRLLIWHFDNINLPPEGTGQVSYFIKPRIDLPSESLILNTADIYFDYNPKMTTPEVANVIDATLPESWVEPLPSVQTSREFDLHWEGSDMHSGIRCFNIYLSVDNSAYILWKKGVTETSAHFLGDFGHTYSFFSTAEDMVGNVEAPPLQPDAETILNDTPDYLDDCPEDPSKIDPGVCGCGTPDTDSDGDGLLDCLDECPDDAGKTAPGICGCGVSDVDSDGDGIADCHDGCPNDALKAAPGICGCGVSDVDSDNDETSDCNDNCPNDQLKINPGLCGCGTADIDSDNDNTPDCLDGCSEDPGKIDPGVCGCGTPDTDSDGDGLLDCLDECPDDAGKTAPGICGCGVSDVDSDGDGVADCNDGCPNDALKAAPGICGCGVSDVDSDNDGTSDCNDNCPNDQLKINPGLCGCGTADIDSDNDNTPDCLDGCSEDPGKIDPGVCGCGTPDTDSDGDGLLDCLDECPESNREATIILDGCDSKVTSRLFPSGCTMSDLIAQLAASAKNHGDFVSKVSHLTNEWQKQGLISGKVKGAIQKCAAQSDIP